jgi:hypothetical protein
MNIGAPGWIDPAQQRIAALIQAVDTIRPAVRDFFASLTDERKASLSLAPKSSKLAANQAQLTLTSP